MSTLRLIIPLIACLLGGWLLFDGTLAWITGDYLTPKNGAGAGQLEPWSQLIAAAGLDPRGSSVKGVHVALGLIWLVSTLVFLFMPALGWFALVGCSLLSRWYAPSAPS